MHIVYWAHSYRDEDAAVNKHFGVLIEKAAGMVVNFDPPSAQLDFILRIRLRLFAEDL